MFAKLVCLIKKFMSSIQINLKEFDSFSPLLLTQVYIIKKKNERKVGRLG